MFVTPTGNTSSKHILNSMYQIVLCVQVRIYGLAIEGSRTCICLPGLISKDVAPGIRHSLS